MISVSEALDLCLTHAMEMTPFPSQRLPLDEALGGVLAEDIRSDIDSPPFDKSLMDGFAVNSPDVAAGGQLRILEVITAGQVPTQPVEPGTATRIMTGAPLPAGADAVVRIEDAILEAGDTRVRFRVSQISAGESILRQGAAMRKGDRVLPEGRLLRPQELGVLAELGKAEIPVRQPPRVAVLATGNELVPVSETPQPGQIRNSNETMLAAQIQRAGAVPERLGIARDEPSHLAEKIQAGLKCDLLILSGGVSAGTLDLVPSELANAGVREVFHHVNVKPGKPVWFGVREDGDSPCLVFGLPGNPVSSMVCFELFARPVIQALLGLSESVSQKTSAVLTHAHENRGDRPVYHPAILARSYGVYCVTLVPWIGSSDLRATVDANAMAILRAENTTYNPGTLLDVIPW